MYGKIYFLWYLVILIIYFGGVMQFFINLIHRRFIIHIFTVFFALGLFAVFIGGALPVILGGYMDKKKLFASKFIEERDRVALELYGVLNNLNNTKFSEVCGTEMLDAMRQAEFQSAYIKDVAFMQGDRVVCSSTFNKIDEPLAEKAPSLENEGVRLWLATPFKHNGTAIDKKSNILI